MRCSGTSCAGRDTETTKLKPQQIPPLAPRRSLLLAISTGKQQVGLLRLLLLLLLLLLIETNKNCCHRPVPALPIVASGNGCSVEFKVESLPPIPDASYISSSSSVKFHANQQQTKNGQRRGKMLASRASPRRSVATLSARGDSDRVGRRHWPAHRHWLQEGGGGGGYLTRFGQRQRRPLPNIARAAHAAPTAPGRTDTVAIARSYWYDGSTVGTGGRIVAARATTPTPTTINAARRLHRPAGGQ